MYVCAHASRSEKNAKKHKKIPFWFSRVVSNVSLLQNRCKTRCLPSVWLAQQLVRPSYGLHDGKTAFKERHPVQEQLWYTQITIQITKLQYWYVKTCALVGLKLVTFCSLDVTDYHYICDALEMYSLLYVCSVVHIVFSMWVAHRSSSLPPEPKAVGLNPYQVVWF
jgi:hypothetical protein